MDAPVAQEHSKVLAETQRGLDGQRRSVRSSIVQTLLYVAFGLLPLVGSSALFGDATVRVTLAAVGPAVIAKWLAFSLYRRVGPDGRAYRASLWMEQLGMYGCVLVFLYASGSTRTIIWAEQPYAAVLWAINAPALWRTNAIGVVGASLAFVVVSAVGHGAAFAAMATGASVFSCTAFGIVAARMLRAARAEAERNMARAELTALAVEGERARVASVLTDHLGEKLAALAREAKDGEARTLLDQLERVLRPMLQPHTLASLAELVEEKCRPLCPDYEQRPPLRREHVVDGQTARALLRIAQELVRNAVTHGAARVVLVELDHDGEALTLRVRDDGRGLSPRTFSTATGGLANAKGWLSELRGSLRLVDSERGTELVARI